MKRTEHERILDKKIINWKKLYECYITRGRKLNRSRLKNEDREQKLEQ